MRHLAFYQAITFLGALVTGQVWIILLGTLYLFATQKFLSKKTNQLKTMDCGDNINIDSIDSPEPIQMAQSFIPYKGCVVEIYSGGKARIMQPSGEDLGKEYPNYKEATKEIDIVAPFLAVNNPEVKGRKVFRGYSTLVIN